MRAGGGAGRADVHGAESARNRQRPLQRELPGVGSRLGAELPTGDVVVLGGVLVPVELDGQPDGDVLFRVAHQGRDAGLRAVRIRPVGELDDGDAVGDGGDHVAQDGLDNDVIGVDLALALNLDVIEVHRAALPAGGEGREPLQVARRAVGEHEPLLFGVLPPLHDVLVGDDLEAAVVGLSGSGAGFGGHDGLAFPQDGGAGHGLHAPAEACRDLGLLDLAASLASVVGVDPLAPARTGVVGAVAKLTDILDHHADPVGVALGQVAAGEVVGAAARVIDLQVALGHVGAGLAAGDEAVGLELDQRSEGEGVVGRCDVDVVLRHA